MAIPTASEKKRASRPTKSRLLQRRRGPESEFVRSSVGEEGPGLPEAAHRARWWRASRPQGGSSDRCHRSRRPPRPALRRWPGRTSRTTAYTVEESFRRTFSRASAVCAVRHRFHHVRASIGRWCLFPTAEVEDRRRTSSQSVAPDAVNFPQMRPGITVRHQRIVVDGVHRLKQFSVVVQLEAREAPSQV